MVRKVLVKAMVDHENRKVLKAQAAIEDMSFQDFLGYHLDKLGNMLRETGGST